jgi:hypothetical protein
MQKLIIRLVYGKTQILFNIAEKVIITLAPGADSINQFTGRNVRTKINYLSVKIRLFSAI